MSVAETRRASCWVSGIQVIEVWFAPVAALTSGAGLADAAARAALPRAAGWVTGTLQALPVSLAPGLGEGVEARLAAVALLTHHARLAAAAAVAVALRAEGALGVAAAGQAAVPVVLAEVSLLAALTVGALGVAQAAEAAVPVPRLHQQVPVKDALPGHPIAVAGFSSFGAEGCEQWGHCQDHEPAPGHCHSPVAGAGHTKPQFQAAALKLRSYL